MDLVILNQPRAYPYDKRVYPTFKRIFDIVVCLILAPIIVPLLVVCAILVCLDSVGPAFFEQERVGKDGARFKMYKLRTMHHNLDISEHQIFQRAFVNGKVVEGEIYKPFHASQVTRIGRVLRKTSLDELPQFLNVLKGEMSLIGPRPNVPWEVEEYKPWHYGRLDVLPGITGLAQVKGRSSISFDSIAQYDIEYAQNLSLWLDVKILWWSVWTIVFAVGAR